MPKASLSVWLAILIVTVSPFASLAAPLMPPGSFVDSSREAALLTSEERQLIAGYRDGNSYSSARLFRANMTALRADEIEVEINGKSQRYVAWDRSSSTQDPVTHAIARQRSDYAGPAIHFWTGSTSLPAKGRPTARFAWAEPGSRMFSGQFVVDGAMYTISTVGRFQVLLAETRPLSAIPGTEPQYVCIDSTGARQSSITPVPGCDRPQRLQSDFVDPGPWIPATLTKAQAEPFERLHRKLRVSPLHCNPEDVTHCDGLVRLSCNAAGDGPVRYHDNATGELIGTCGFWVRDPTCMPQRWKVCAIKNRVRHIGEEPDPSR
jgi:hypothetical protein